MRNRGLCQVHALFDIGRAEAGFLLEGASPFFRQSAQDTAPSRIDDGLEETIEIRRWMEHREAWLIL